MAAKVPACAKIAIDAVEQCDQCVVIGLQSTGEANMNAVRYQRDHAMQHQAVYIEAMFL